jgi:membrane-bound ClpP family serine protease
VAIALGFFFILRKAVGARSPQDSVSASALIGSLGETRGPLSPSGQVFVAGAVWPAISSSGPIPSGHAVRVVAQERESLRVEPASDAGSRQGTA